MRQPERLIGSALLIAGTFAALLALSALAQAKDCNKGASPSETRRLEKAGCGTASAGVPKPDAHPNLRVGQRPGFIDLGNGTEIRVGGRARLDIDHSR